MSMVDDWPMGRIVQIMNWGRLTDVVIIGYDQGTEQVQYSHSPTGGYGSGYIKVDRLLIWNEPSPTY